MPPTLLPVAHAADVLDEAAGFALYATTDDQSINARRSWGGLFKLEDGDYESKSVRSVRMYFLPDRVADPNYPTPTGRYSNVNRSFPAEERYQVQLKTNGKVTEDFGAVTGYGFEDARGYKWLDITLPKTVTIGQAEALFISNAAGADTLPWRAYNSSVGARGFAEPLDAQPATIHSKVVRADSAEPAEGVEVSLVGADGKPLQTQTTNADGTVTFADVEPGRTYTIKSGTLDGYFAEQPVSLTVASGQEYTPTPIELTPIGVMGRVIDEYTKPVEGVPVSIGELETTTDADGTFTLTRVPEGEQKISVGGSARTLPTSSSVWAEPTERNRARDITVDAKPGAIAGTVVDSSGTPVAGVNVSTGKHKTVTNRDGSFQFPDLKPGTYDISVSATETIEGGVLQGVTVAPGEIASVHVPVKRMTGALSGVVVSDRKTPIAGAAVKVHAEDDPARAIAATTDNNGAFQAAGLPPGTYVVDVVADGYTASTTSVVVSPNKTVALEVTLAPTPTPKPAPKPAPTTKKTTPKKTTPKTTTKPKPTLTTKKPVPKPTPTTKKPAPKPTPTTKKPAPKPTPTTKKPAPKPTLAPVENFGWGDIEVRPGEIEIANPQKSAGRGVAFVVDGVTRQDGQPLLDATWVTVDQNGTVAAAPQANVAPGKYKAEIRNSTGGHNVVTITVGKPQSEAALYDVSYEPRTVRAGERARSPKPAATRTITPEKYGWQPLPAGTGYRIIKNPNATVTSDGRVELKVPKDAKPGSTIKVKVAITFPDGSKDEAIVPFEIVESPIADRLAPSYEAGVLVGPGQHTMITAHTSKGVPDGTEYALDEDTELGGWVVGVNERTGALDVTAPSADAKPVKVPVKVRFPDGSERTITARIGVATATAPKRGTTLTYPATVSKTGRVVTAKPKGSVPEGTVFVLMDDAGMRVDVDQRTGNVRADVPASAPADATYTVRVRAQYPDGTTALLPLKVTTDSQARRDSKDSKGTATAPKGTTFGLSEKFDEPGWYVSVDKRTGELSVDVDADATKKKSVQVPVVVSYPDGSQRIKNVKANAPALQTVTPTPQDAPSGASSGYSWVPIVLGLLAAIGGVGYAAFVNQDHIRRMLSQFGIRI
ncbi:hypothetical protein GW964_04505 [Corynebacterium godavarianum]|uniref:YPDG domain-containing protein n=1 Tax=Corynebacterium godavarianum TaxID=2054421 RepID=UPI001933CB56|nr:hypothetical protein [Corynebacterium godavarianum]